MFGLDVGPDAVSGLVENLLEMVSQRVVVPASGVPDPAGQGTDAWDHRDHAEKCAGASCETLCQGQTELGPGRSVERNPDGP